PQKTQRKRGLSLSKRNSHFFSSIIFENLVLIDPFFHRYFILIIYYTKYLLVMQEKKGKGEKETGRQGEWEKRRKGDRETRRKGEREKEKRK
nr:hypothetical protein [Candidatus Neomarinimicrobiota bacterium]